MRGCGPCPHSLGFEPRATALTSPDPLALPQAVLLAAVKSTRAPRAAPRAPERIAAQRSAEARPRARAPPALAREADAAASAPVARLGLAVPLGELHELLQEVATDMARFFWNPLAYSSAFRLRLALLFLTCFFSPFSLSSLAFSLKTLCRSSGTGSWAGGGAAGPAAAQGCGRSSCCRRGGSDSWASGGSAHSMRSCRSTPL